MNPHEVLNLPPSGFTVEQLRHNYKVLALQLHPDKRNCSLDIATQMFHVLTDAYRTLLSRLEARKEDSDFASLRQDFLAHRRQQEREAEAAEGGQRSGEGGGKGFNVNRFNNVFAQNRVPDPVADAGYEQWMKENDPDNPATARKAAALIRRHRGDEPEPTSTSRACIAYSVLGETGVVDYSGRLKSRAVPYSDYRIAHTTERLATDEEFARAELRIARELRSVEELEKHRSGISYTMTEQEARQEQARARERDQSERQRMDALDAYDRMINEVHTRTTRLLI